MVKKLFISADLEGVNWVTSPLQLTTHKDREAYGRAVTQLALEVTTVAEAALAAGVEDILVNDAHCAMSNLPITALPPRVSILSGKPKLCAMSAGLDNSFDGAIFIGYHGKAGTEKGVLNHTFHDRLFDVSVNGVSYGEGGINALYASLVHNVPLVMASGDVAFSNEIHTLLPNLPVVVTKTGLTTTAAQCRPQEEVLADYRTITQQVIAHHGTWKHNLLKLQPPYTLQVTFTHSLYADTALTMPWVTRVDGRTVTCEAKDFQALYQALQSCYSILSYTSFLE